MQRQKLSFSFTLYILAVIFYMSTIYSPVVKFSSGELSIYDRLTIFGLGLFFFAIGLAGYGAYRSYLGQSSLEGGTLSTTFALIPALAINNLEQVKLQHPDATLDMGAFLIWFAIIFSLLGALVSYYMEK